MTNFELQGKATRDMTNATDQLVIATNEVSRHWRSFAAMLSGLPMMRGEQGMSRAIELARAGATKDAVADATGLSLEEAEAIVTFHGAAAPDSARHCFLVICLVGVPD